MVLEETVSGGQAGNSPMIRNYPGFPHGVSGHELTRKACEQAWMFGAHMVFAQRAAGLDCRGGQRVVRLADGHQVRAGAVIVAPGIAWRRLGVPRLEALVGSGVFYGAAGAEARAMAGQDVFVVGAGNSAGQSALHLARYARQVTHAGPRGQPGPVDVGLPDPGDRGHRQHHRAAAHRGHRRARPGPAWRRSPLCDKRRGRSADVPASALFVLIGGEPRTQWLPAAVQLADGYIRTGRDVLRGRAGPGQWPDGRPPLPLETSVPGVFAVGDARYRSIKRVASAVGDGATAVRLVQEYLASASAAA